MNTINGKFLRTTPAIGIPKDDTKFVLQVIDDVLENVEKEDKVGCPPFVYTKIVAQVPFVRSIHNWLDFAIQLADEVECERFQFKKMKNDSYSSDINFSNYVSRQGICIIIMGHPNPCLYEIGNRLAKDIDSFHIDAITLVSNEIRKKTFIGKWIYSNIYAGKHVPFVIMNKLLVAELSIKKYRRQGYVLTGFPLIPTFLEPEFLPCSVYNTPCVVLPTAQDLDDPEHFNLVGDEDFFNTYLSFENEDTLSAFDEDDGYDGNSTSTDDSEGEDDLDENKWLLNEIKNFINESEFVYPTDYKCGKFVNESIANQLHFLNNLKLRPELIIYINNETEFTFAKRTKSEPEDEVEKQLEVYEHAFYTIQKYILKFDKDLVIVIDNRQDLDYTLTCIKNRFEYMNYKKFIQPNVIFPDGIPRRFQIVLDELNQEKNLRIICNVNRILPELNWSPSQFMTRCPVKMYEGKIENGLEEYAVRYLRFTYFLSSEKAMDKFIKSPEKFFFIRPTCRVAIVGTNRVGKSVLTEVMRRLFKSEVYSTQSRVADLWAGNCDNKYIDSLKYAFKKAVSWANKQSRYYERLRNTKIKEWKHNISYILQSLIDGLFSEETLIKDAQPFMFFENHENLNEFLPKKWLKSNQLDPQINDGIVQMLFHEHIFETYTNSLADKTHISKDFIRWLRKIDNSKSLETNGDKNHAHWIIDNAPVNISFWEDIAHSHCLPDHVIFLKNSSLQKIFKSYGSKFNSRFVHFANIITSLCNENKQWFDINQFDLNDLFNTQHTSNKDKNVSLYAKFIAEMKLKQLPYIERDFSILQEFLTTNNIPFIVTDNKCFKSSILDSINKFLNFFEYPATNLKNTYFKGYNIEPYDRTFDYEIVKMELEDEEAFLDEDDMDDDSISNHGIDEDALDSDDEDVIADEYLKNFSSWNFGNTYDYCPVSFLDEGFLIRGNPSFGADYCNKVYCMRSAKERKLFLANPKKYSFLNSRPIPPAPRVFFLGPNNGYKCTMADFLANKMHVNLLSYQKLMQPFIKAANSINEDYSIDNFEKVYAEISADFIRNLVVNLKSNGGILVGYPLTLKQFQDIIENKMYPEAVITVADEWNDCFKAMFKHYARSYLIKSVYSQRYSNNSNFNGLALDARLSLLSSDIDKLDEDARSEITIQCEKILKPYFKEVENIKQLCNMLRIPVLEVPKLKVKGCSVNSNVTKIMDKINRDKNRLALFETTRVIDFEYGENLLNTGYFLYSRNKRSGPVDVVSLNCFNRYNGKHKNIFPCIYRDFVYFLTNKSNLKMFRENPYKYLSTCNPQQMESPLRIAVMGCLSSGVSSICQRISDEYGMKIYTRSDFEIMLKSKLKNCILGKKFAEDSQLTDDLIIECIKICQYDTPNGIIIDNVSFNSTFFVNAAKHMVDFQIVFILIPTFMKVWENWCSTNKRRKMCPFEELIQLQKNHEQFMVKVNDIKNCESCFYLNLVYIENKDNKWSTWNDINFEVLKTARSIVGYEVKQKKSKYTSLSHLNVLMEQFHSHLTESLLFCPTCLSENRISKFRFDFHSVGPSFYSKQCQMKICAPYGYINEDIYVRYKFPHYSEVCTNKTPILLGEKFEVGAIQFAKKFYWICTWHILDVMINSLLPLSNKSMLPPFMPFLIQNISMQILAYDGYCIICYNKTILEKGNSNLCVFYRGKIYVFCSILHTIKFLNKPESYYKLAFVLKVIEEADWDIQNMQIDYGKLTPEILSNALYELGKLRPKHFALNVTESAIMYIAYTLKISHCIDFDINRYWKKCFMQFLNECQIIPNRLTKFKYNFNPFMLIDKQTEEEIYAKMPKSEFYKKQVKSKDCFCDF